MTVLLSFLRLRILKFRCAGSSGRGGRICGGARFCACGGLVSDGDADVALAVLAVKPSVQTAAFVSRIGWASLQVEAGTVARCLISCWRRPPMKDGPVIFLAPGRAVHAPVHFAAAKTRSRGGLSFSTPSHHALTCTRT